MFPHVHTGRVGKLTAMPEPTHVRESRDAAETKACTSGGGHQPKLWALCSKMIVPGQVSFRDALPESFIVLTQPVSHRLVYADPEEISLGSRNPDSEAF